MSNVNSISHPKVNYSVVQLSAVYSLAEPPVAGSGYQLKAS